MGIALHPASNVAVLIVIKNFTEKTHLINDKGQGEFMRGRVNEGSTQVNTRPKVKL